MHPAVRVLIVLVLASALPSMSLGALVLLGVLAAAFYFRFALDSLGRLRAGLLRLRWLILAILVLYVGFTPGDPLFPSLPGITREGVAEGLRRSLVLIDLLVIVYLLLAITPMAELAGAVCFLLTPLRPLGVDPRRVGLRIALALENVADVDARLRASVRGPGGSSNGWERAAALIDRIEMEADKPGTPVLLHEKGRPRRWEWLVPLALAVILHRWMP